MLKNKGFDPISYITAGRESADSRALEVAYHLSTIGVDELAQKSELEETIDEQIARVDELYTNMQDITTRVAQYRAKGEISARDRAEIAEKYPEALDTFTPAIESATIQGAELNAALESLNRFAMGLLFAMIAAVLGGIVRWIMGRKGSDKGAGGSIKEAVAEAKVAPSGRKEYRWDKVAELFEEGCKPDCKDADAKKIAVAVKNLLGNDVSVSEVKRVFAEHPRYATLMAHGKLPVATSPVFKNSGGEAKINTDVKFLEANQSGFKSFIKDALQFYHDIYIWYLALGTAEGGITQQDVELTPETEINRLDMSVLIEMSKALSISFNQPPANISPDIAGRFVSLNPSDMTAYLKDYRPDAGAEINTTSFVDSFENVSDAIIHLAEAVNAWSRCLTDRAREIKDSADRAQSFRSKFQHGRPPKGEDKYKEVEDMAKAVSQNFRLLNEYVVTIYNFTDNYDKALKVIRVNLKTIRGIISN